MPVKVRVLSVKASHVGSAVSSAFVAALAQGVAGVRVVERVRPGIGIAERRACRRRLVRDHVRPPSGRRWWWWSPRRCRWAVEMPLLPPRPVTVRVKTRSVPAVTCGIVTVGSAMADTRQTLPSLRTSAWSAPRHRSRSCPPAPPLPLPSSITVPPAAGTVPSSGRATAVGLKGAPRIARQDQTQPARSTLGTRRREARPASCCSDTAPSARSACRILRAGSAVSGLPVRNSASSAVSSSNTPAGSAVSERVAPQTQNGQRGQLVEYVVGKRGQRVVVQIQNGQRGQLVEYCGGKRGQRVVMQTQIRQRGQLVEYSGGKRGQRVALQNQRRQRSQLVEYVVGKRGQRVAAQTQPLPARSARRILRREARSASCSPEPASSARSARRILRRGSAVSEFVVQPTAVPARSARRILRREARSARCSPDPDTSARSARRNPQPQER